MLNFLRTNTVPFYCRAFRCVTEGSAVGGRRTSSVISSEPTSSAVSSMPPPGTSKTRPFFKLADSRQMKHETAGKCQANSEGRERRDTREQTSIINHHKREQESLRERGAIESRINQTTPRQQDSKSRATTLELLLPCFRLHVATLINKLLIKIHY